MGFNPTVRTEKTVIGEDRTWLVTRKGWDTLRPITLDVSLFTEAEHVDGAVIHSGILLGQVTASEKYGPYDPTTPATDGTEDPLGFLFSSVQLDDEDITVASDPAVALIWEGVVSQANFYDFGAVSGMIDAAAIAAMPNFRFEA